MKVGFVTFEKAANREFNSIGSSRIRARWVAKYWPDADGEWIIGKEYDVLIFQKVYWDEMMESFRGIKILDLCDPDWLERKDVMKYINMADACTTSTEALAEYIRKFFLPDKLIRCIPDRVDLEEHQTIKQSHEGIAKSAVWFGYSHNARYLEKTFDLLIQKGISLTTICDQRLILPSAFNALKIDFIKYKYEIIHQELIKHDFVLLPETAEQDLRGRYKSNNKVLTAWALGMPVVQVPDDLERFSDPTERKKEAELRLKEVKEKWDCKLSVKEYQDLIAEIQRRKNGN